MIYSGAGARSLTRCLAMAVWLTLTACGGSDSPAPTALPAIQMSAAPATVNSESGSTLTWSSTNATSCAASGGWSGAKSTSGSQFTGALTASTTFTLICSGPGGTGGVANVVVNVVPTAVLSANPSVVASGGTAVLSWSSVNATSCTAAGGWNGQQTTDGTQSTGALTVATTYSMTCTGAGGTSSQASVTVNLVPTVALTASVGATPPGGAALLSWTSSNAASCSASGGWSGTKSTGGSQSTGALTAPTTFSLSCTGPGGSSKPASATIVTGVVTIVPRVVALTLSQPQQFTVTLPGGGSASWTVDGVSGGNSTVGQIGATGLYTPGTAAGIHNIAATSVAYPVLSGSAVAAVTDLAGVYTFHNDSSRDGANTQEYALTPSNVTTGTFGKLFSCAVDGAILGQPLWVAGLTVGSARRNVVFVATEHDSLYAFDADASPCTPLWSVSLIDAAHGASSGETTVPSGVTGYLVGRGAGDLAPEVGVTGTPVVDPVNGVLYVVSKSVSSSQTNFFQRLHAIDLTTGTEKVGSPATIAGTYPGTGDGGSTVTFNPRTENQRGGLAFANGIVYIAWAAHEDVAPWYGWVMGYSYNGASISQVAVFNAAPNVQDGGIWMGGGAPAFDSNGNLYLVTGNGSFDATSSSAPNNDYGDSLLELTSNLALSQYFTPSDQLTDNGNDLDFGAGGAAVLANLPAGSPVSHLLICGGKDSNLYVVNRDSLGGFGDGIAVQKIDFGYRVFATGAYWNANYYLAGSAGPLVDYSLDASVPQFTVAASSSHTYGFGGSTPSLSAAANQNGIVWTLDNGQYCTSSTAGCGPAVLYAHDAANVGTELWNSATSSTDAAGNAVKFTVPTVANGKVYVGTRGNNAGGATGSTTIAGELDVYGLKPN